jgi:hypothetical protein
MSAFTTGDEVRDTDQLRLIGDIQPRARSIRDREVDAKDAQDAAPDLEDERKQPAEQRLSLPWRSFGGRSALMVLALRARGLGWRDHGVVGLLALTVVI